MKKKRLATVEEVDMTLKQEQLRHPMADINALHSKAIEEGFKDEVCPKCGIIFLAHHHMTNCPDSDCPMKDGSGKSVLDLLLEDANEALGGKG